MLCIFAYINILDFDIIDVQDNSKIKKIIYVQLQDKYLSNGDGDDIRDFCIYFYYGDSCRDVYKFTNGRKDK